MSFLRNEMTVQSWARVGRIAGAGLGGAVIGVLVARICIAVVPDVAAIAGSIVVTADSATAASPAPAAIAAAHGAGRRSPG